MLPACSTHDDTVPIFVERIPTVGTGCPGHLIGHVVSRAANGDEVALMDALGSLLSGYVGLAFANDKLGLVV